MTRRLIVLAACPLLATIMTGCTGPSGADVAPSPTGKPSSDAPTSAATSATPSPSSRSPEPVLTLPDPDAPAAHFSGRGQTRIPVPAQFLAGKKLTVDVYLVCAPTNAPFSVSVTGVRKFWGACSSGPGSVAGAFALRPTDRSVTLTVNPDVRWQLALTCR